MRYESAHLVYQCGIANVFGIVDLEGGRGPEWMGGPQYVRLAQCDYRSCECWAAGMAAAGVPLSVWHCDEAGDILVGQEWSRGPGELWNESKHPPVTRVHA